MSTRPAHWMRPEAHDLITSEVLQRHATSAGWTPGMPIPVEQIIEATYGLRIDWQVLPEATGEQILGALYWHRKLIVMNETHLDGVFRWRGPIEFTLAHELGHWIYDIDHNRDQGSLFDSESSRDGFCRGEDGLGGQAKTREQNADRFAARLLMPRELVVADLRDGAADLPDEALMDRWCVSRTALKIRFEELGLSRDSRQGALRLG